MFCGVFFLGASGMGFGYGGIIAQPPAGDHPLFKQGALW